MKKLFDKWLKRRRLMREYKRLERMRFDAITVVDLLNIMEKRTIVKTELRRL